MPSRLDIVEANPNYSPMSAETRDKVLEMIVEGKTLMEIEQAGVCNHSTIRKWVVYDPEFAAAYFAAQRAKILQYADDTVAIADESVGSSHEAQRNKLRVETRQWHLARLMPKVYGDKVQTEISAGEGAPMINVVITTSGGEVLLTSAGQGSRKTSEEESEVPRDD